MTSTRYMLETIDRKDRGRFVRFILLSLLSPALDIFSISMLLPILSDLASGEPADSVLPRIFAIGAMLLLKTVYDILLRRLEDSFRCDCIHKLSLRIFELSVSEDFPAHRKMTHSTNLARVRPDVTSSVNMLLGAALLTVDALTFVGFAVVLMVAAGFTGLFCLLGISAVLCLLFFANRARIKAYGEKIRNMEIKAGEMVYHAFGAYKEVRIDGRRDELVRRFDRASAELIKEQKKYSLFAGGTAVLATDVLQAFVFFGLGLLILFKVDFGAHLTAFAVAVTVLIKLMPLGARLLHGLMNMTYAKSAFLNFKKANDEWTALQKNADIAENLRVHRPSFERGVTMKGVTFSYEDGTEPILQDADITVPKGATVAITGSSGIGKTTFLDLLIGLLKPQKGEILYDDADIAAGRDVEGACRIEIGGLISYIPQDIYLNGYTIRENVTFLAPAEEADEARIEECLRIAKLYDDVCAMPDGLDTLIGESGVRLSGGQRQRLALARALYKDFELLILDEATASLDMETETAILESIREKKPGKTVLLVTHHTGLAEACEMQYRLEDRKFKRVR
ncbi:MAG: ABC transporter ATP-binding protein [Lachnospiraceae bacterium]|nr:ABC transporter ATP-binding protein [Lachnospiraceae bacterium]